MKAGEIMSTVVIAVNRSTTLDKLIDLLSKHNISGVPVLDQDRRVVGIISEADILKYSRQNKIIPYTALSGWAGAENPIADHGVLNKSLDTLKNTTVDQVMTREVATADEDTTIAELSRIMNINNINRIPIVDRNHRLIGIVSRNDLVKLLAERDKYLR